MDSAELLPLAGPGFVLRRLTTGDLTDFQAYRHDEQLGRYQGWLPTPDETARAFLAEMSVAPFPNLGHWFQFGIAEPDQQRLIGDVGVFLDRDGTFAEIGFTLARSAQGHGVATAAIRAVIALIFECSAAQRVIGVTDARNLSSMRLMQRVGMRKTTTNEAVFRGEACLEHTYTVTRADLCSRPMMLGDVFVIDEAATPERLAQAIEILDRCTGIVMLMPVIVLRPGVREIRCEVFDTASAAHRCEDEYKVLVENAARALERSRLGALLPHRPLRWAVVEVHGSEAVEVWSG